MKGGRRAAGEAPALLRHKRLSSAGGAETTHLLEQRSRPALVAPIMRRPGAPRPRGRASVTSCEPMRERCAEMPFVMRPMMRNTPALMKRNLRKTCEGVNFGSTVQAPAGVFLTAVHLRRAPRYSMLGYIRAVC